MPISLGYPCNLEQSASQAQHPPVDLPVLQQQGATSSAVPGPIAGSPSGRADAPLELLVAGMRQLQEATLRATSGPPKADTAETIKPGVTSLPVLPEPSQDAPVDFQVWMYSISRVMDQEN